MTADDQWADSLRLQLDRADRVQRTADALAHAKAAAAFTPPGTVEKAAEAHRRAVEAWRLGEKGLA